MEYAIALAEGYSRGTGKDRARFYEYALGSARESRDWYFKGRHILGEAIVVHRIQLITQIIRLLLTMVPQQRTQSVYEGEPIYHVTIADQESSELTDLTHPVPMPQETPIP